MFGIRFIKTRPIDYVLLFRSGKIRKQGAGLSFFYYAPSSTLVIVPADTRDSPFIFKETTLDFQEIDIQGQVTYRVLDPQKLASLLDFTVDARGKYLGDGVEKLDFRMANLIQVAVREKFRSLNLKDALTAASSLADPVLEKLRQSTTLNELGIEVFDFSILKISPTPEIARALEAAARENLLKNADDAVYQRRNFAVEQERKIKENELQTQIAVEEKNRTIRETQMNAEIAVQEKQKLVEEARMDAVQAVEKKKIEIDNQKLTSQIEQEKKRKELVESQAKNLLEYSKARGQAAKEELSALKDLSPEIVEILASGQMDTSKIISKAIRDLARNAEKIGNLNLSPELMTLLMAKEKGK
ncbi:band 7 protein [Leptospira perolatii]|uniref:Band 7 protein n=1 Tax=Leptospira perolatii TaxID=2023191 RepID=A0A2M9ZRP0_9LEPT|nr:SPFH domain-containing protein [Leptospira perolatii]PJZ71224.1 band 7 protein [Leptospira perolatii]PJZ74757.1 band 7 protein [Leptospira perolatii]